MKTIKNLEELRGVSLNEPVEINGREEGVVSKSIGGGGTDIRTIRREGVHIIESHYDGTSLEPFVFVGGVREIKNGLEKGTILLNYNFYHKKLRKRNRQRMNFRDILLNRIMF